jgi:hypothetical protein
VPAGYVATVLPTYKSNDVVLSLPNLGAFIVASDKESLPGNYSLIRETNSSDGKESVSWVFQMTSEGSSSGGRVLNLPESFPTLLDSSPITLEPERDGKTSVWLESIDGEELDIGLILQTHRTVLATSEGIDVGIVGNGTNWVQAVKRD